MPTIRDVAKLSRVSIATVSHVLNNRSAKVGTDTRERVLAAVRELRYRPTALEDRQKSTRTYNLALLVQDMTLGPITNNHYFGAMLNRVVESAALRGYSTTIAVETMWDDVGSSIRRSYDGHCDGVILLAPNPASAALKTLWERGANMVSVGSSCYLPGVSTVDINNKSTGYRATRYLLGLGHRSVGFLGGGADSPSVLERCSGYLQAMAEAGIAESDVCAVLWRGVGDNWRGITPARRAFGVETPYRDRVVEVIGSDDTVACDLVERAMPRVTGAVCWNDVVARRSVNALLDLGIVIPRDLSLVSIDDCPIATAAEPHLTTFRQPFPAIGKAAVDILLRFLDDPSTEDQHIRFEAELVIRESARELVAA